MSLRETNISPHRYTFCSVTVLSRYYTLYCKFPFNMFDQIPPELVLQTIEYFAVDNESHIDFNRDTSASNTWQNIRTLASIRLTCTKLRDSATSVMFRTFIKPTSWTPIGPTMNPSLDGLAPQLPRFLRTLSEHQYLREFVKYVHIGGYGGSFIGTQRRKSYPYAPRSLERDRFYHVAEQYDLKANNLEWLTDLRGRVGSYNPPTEDAEIVLLLFLVGDLSGLTLNLYEDYYTDDVRGDVAQLTPFTASYLDAYLPSSTTLRTLEIHVHYPPLLAEYRPQLSKILCMPSLEELKLYAVSIDWKDDSMESGADDCPNDSSIRYLTLYFDEEAWDIQRWLIRCPNLQSFRFAALASRDRKGLPSPWLQARSILLGLHKAAESLHTLHIQLRASLPEDSWHDLPLSLFEALKTFEINEASLRPGKKNEIHALSA